MDRSQSGRCQLYRDTTCTEDTTGRKARTMSITRYARAKRIVAVIFAASILSGCAADAGTDAPEPSSGAITTEAELSAPTGKTILKITGEISGSNHKNGVHLDMATLEDMPVVETTLYEPFLKTDITFSGVMMEDFLKVIGADPSAGGVRMTALDDFVADLPMSDLMSGTVMLATRQDGAPLKVREGGPARIVFMNQDGLGANTDMWIWSVYTMKVHS